MPSAGSIRARNKAHQQESLGRQKKNKDEKKEEKSQIGPFVLAILIFVVIGSTLVQIIQNARNAMNMGEQAQME